MYIIRVLLKWKHTFRDTVWAQSLPVPLCWWREPVHSSELLKCLLKHLQRGGLKEGCSCCSAGVYETLEVSQSRILILWANSDVRWLEHLPGFSPLFQSATLGWRSCWVFLTEDHGWPQYRYPWNSSQWRCNKAVPLQAELAVVVQKLGFFLASVCCDHDFTRDASSSPSHSSCFGTNWWSFCILYLSTSCRGLQISVWARCVSRA